MKKGKVLKSIRPGEPGSHQWLKKFGGKLVAVRYRVDPKRRVRSTTVEIVVEEAYWDPSGYENYKRAMSKSGQSA